MLRIRSWERWQRPFIYEVTRRRKDKGAPVTMRYVALAGDLDDEPREGESEGNWRRFARLVGPRQAETMLVRVLQYVATKAALTGQIRVSRESFGAVVLSRDLDVVSRADGERVYDALVLSAIAEEPAGHVTGQPSGEMTGELPGQSPGHPSGRVPGPTPGQSPGDMPGDLPSLAGAPARARSVSVSEDGFPPLPSPAGEGGGRSASHAGSDLDTAEPLTVGERAAAAVVAEAIERGDVRLDPDDEQRGVERDRAGAEAAKRDATKARDGSALATAERRLDELARRRRELAEHRRAVAATLLRSGGPDARPLLERWQASDVLVGARDHRIPLRVACNAARDAARADARDRRRDARDRGGPA